MELKGVSAGTRTQANNTKNGTQITNKHICKNIRSVKLLRMNLFANKCSEFISLETFFTHTHKMANRTELYPRYNLLTAHKVKHMKIDFLKFSRSPKEKWMCELSVIFIKIHRQDQKSSQLFRCIFDFVSVLRPFYHVESKVSTLWN